MKVDTNCHVGGGRGCGLPTASVELGEVALGRYVHVNLLLQIPLSIIMHVENRQETLYNYYYSCFGRDSNPQPLS